MAYYEETVYSRDLRDKEVWLEDGIEVLFTIRVGDPEETISVGTHIGTHKNEILLDLTRCELLRDALNEAINIARGHKIKRLKWEAEKKARRLSYLIKGGELILRD